MLTPPQRVYHYHHTALERARQIFQATNQLITNPRDTQDHSLMSMDIDWVDDLSRYMREVQYQRDDLKRRKGAK